MSLDVEAVVTATKAQVISIHQKTFCAVGTDTRLDLTDQLFVALRGETFDAHDFVNEAIKQKAVVLLLDQREVAERFSGQVTCLLVKDTLEALQDLAHYWRKQLSAKVVAITGSNGKTTTKEFLATIIKKELQVTANRGSFNNHWGVPLTLLSAKKSDEVVILEMGMNHLGELTKLCQIAEPEITLVTCVGSAHIGNLGSMDQVAQAKNEIYRACPRSQAIFNLDNTYTFKMFENFSGIQKLTFSESKKNSTVCLCVKQAGMDFIEVEGHIGSVKGAARISVFGRHNVYNAMGAATIALALGLCPKKIWTALKECRAFWGRNQIVKLKSGAQVLFDAYNSSPESFNAMSQSLQPKKTGQLFFVVGQMRELGHESAQAHYEMGRRVGFCPVDLVWFIGEDHSAFREGLKSVLFQGKSYYSKIYKQDIALLIGSMLQPYDMAVLKGSRRVGLERVLQDWGPVDFIK